MGPTTGCADSVNCFWAVHTGKLIIAAVLASGLVGCSSDSTDPDDNAPPNEFGIVAFTPSFLDIGLQRSAQLGVGNTGTASVSPVLLSVDDVRRTTMPDSPCTTIAAEASPSWIGSLAPGEEVAIQISFDTESVDFLECPPGQYDAGVRATVSGTVVASAGVRFAVDAPCQCSVI